MAQLALRQAATVHPLAGIGLKVGATIAFTIMNAVIRSVGHVPVGEIIFFRSSFALVPLLIVAAWSGSIIAAITTERPALHLMRSLIGSSSMFFYFTAVSILPLADSTAFSFVMPIFSVVLAALILRENVGIWRWSAVAIGFCGVLLIIEPHGGVRSIIGGGISYGAAAGLIGSLISAFVVIFIRQMSKTERSEAIVFYFMLTSACIGAVTMFWASIWPTPWELVLLITIGLLGGIGQICMTFSYRLAEPSMLAPFDYVAIVWATILGYIIFDELPVWQVIAGSSIIIVSGLFIAWREHRRGQEKPKPQSL